MDRNTHEAKAQFSMWADTMGTQDRVRRFLKNTWNQSKQGAEIIFLMLSGKTIRNITTSSKGGAFSMGSQHLAFTGFSFLCKTRGKSHSSHAWFHFSLCLWLTSSLLFSSAILLILFSLKRFYLSLLHDPLCVTLKFYSLLFLIHQGAWQGSLNIIRNILS